MEQLLEERHLTLLNGEQLNLDVGIRIAFETTSMADVITNALIRHFIFAIPFHALLFVNLVFPIIGESVFFSSNST